MRRRLKLSLWFAPRLLAMRNDLIGQLAQAEALDAAARRCRRRAGGARNATYRDISGSEWEII